MIYRLNKILGKFSAEIFVVIDNLILRFICKFQGPKMAKRPWIKNKIRGLTLPHIKIYKAIVMTTQFWCQATSINQ